MKLNCVQIFYDVCESHFQMFYCLNSVSKQGFLCLSSVFFLPDLRTTSLLKFVTMFVVKAPCIGPLSCPRTQSDSLDCRPWSFWTVWPQAFYFVSSLRPTQKQVSIKYVHSEIFHKFYMVLCVPFCWYPLTLSPQCWCYYTNMVSLISNFHSNSHKLCQFLLSLTIIVFTFSGVPHLRLKFLQSNVSVYYCVQNMHTA